MPGNYDLGVDSHLRQTLETAVTESTNPRLVKRIRKYRKDADCGFVTSVLLSPSWINEIKILIQARTEHEGRRLWQAGTHVDI